MAVPSVVYVVVRKRKNNGDSVPVKVFVGTGEGFEAYCKANAYVDGSPDKDNLSVFRVDAEE
jgi:hypothetical protein